MTDAGYAILLAVATLLVALLGLAQLLAGSAQKAAMRQRTALDAVEARAAKRSNRLEAELLRTGWGRAIALQLAAGGIERRVLDVVAAGVLLAVGSFLVADRILPWVVAAGIAALALRAGWMWVQRRQEVRNDAFVAQLPDLARVLANSASAGLAVSSALDLAQSELEDPAAEELSKVGQLLGVGQSVDVALQTLQERVPSREVGVLVNTLVIHQRAGGDLIEALRDMALTLEARKDLRREVRTMMAGAVSTGYVVFGLGIGGLLLVNVAIPGALDEVLGSAGGRIAALASASLFACGFLLIRRITRIET